MARVSKGKLNNLRLVYRGIANRTKFIATMRKNYSGAYAKNPEQTEAMIQEAATWFDWSTVSVVLPNGDTVSRSKKSHYPTAITGKHRNHASGEPDLYGGCTKIIGKYDKWL
jgi:hypothetical protein